MLCDALADSIRERLFGHEFAPCVPLDKAALAARYGTGRLALAAALARLARDRLLMVREDGEYCVAEYCRADIEDVLEALERIRFFMLRRSLSATIAQELEKDAVTGSPYWGLSGFVVTRAFALPARSLYGQLRLGVGPGLAAIEAQCANECHDALRRVVASGEVGQIEACCAETAQMFRQRVLALFDEACRRA
jgi:DNA-binding GntR family transcriptional regulator